MRGGAKRRGLTKESAAACLSGLRTVRNAALQVELCRRFVNRSISFLDFTHTFTNPHPSRNVTDHARKFGSVVLEPLVRDVMRLPESRPLPPILFTAMGQLPPSGDAVLDGLLAEACRNFKDSAPTAVRQAVEKLWDAWERLKTLRDRGDKRASAQAMLEATAGDPDFLKVLEQEAKVLTEIGNSFQIRHFETNRFQLSTPEHYEYLFHRLYALVHLVLYPTQRLSKRTFVEPALRRMLSPKSSSSSTDLT